MNCLKMYQSGTQFITPSPARVPVSGKAWLELVSCSWLKNAGWAVSAGHRSAAHCSGITRPLAQHSPVGSQLARS